MEDGAQSRRNGRVPKGERNEEPQNRALRNAVCGYRSIKNGVQTVHKNMCT